MRICSFLPAPLVQASYGICSLGCDLSVLPASRDRALPLHPPALCAVLCSPSLLENFSFRLVSYLLLHWAGSGSVLGTGDLCADTEFSQRDLQCHG